MADNMRTLILATRNIHKVEEIQKILGSVVRCRSLAEFPGAPLLIEDGATFAENATRKAVQLANWLCDQRSADGSVLADDSGLEVDALNGAPGVHSARFAALDSGAEGNSSDEDNNRKLLRLLESIPPPGRTCRFRCVLALVDIPAAPISSNASPVCDADEAELSTQLFTGACDGTLSSLANGTNGFGYDPLFIPNGYEQSFAELPREIKNRISHRAKALEQLRISFERSS
jgi:XTP/dITP diphosphohydrolase